MKRLFLIIALLLITGVAAAQEPTPPTVSHDEVNTVASKLYCPVCENEPLHTCMAPACVQWRAEIRRQLEEGRSEAQVISYFVDTYGDRVVGIPQDPFLRNFALAAPVLITIIGLAIGLWTFSRWRSRREDPLTEVNAPAINNDHTDNDLRSQLERDLKY